MPYLSPTEYSNLMGNIDRIQTRLNFAVDALRSCEDHFEYEQPFDDLEACALDEGDEGEYRELLNLRQKIRMMIKT